MRTSFVNRPYIVFVHVFCFCFSPLSLLCLVRRKLSQNPDLSRVPIYLGPDVLCFRVYAYVLVKNIFVVSIYAHAAIQPYMS